MTQMRFLPLLLALSLAGCSQPVAPKAERRAADVRVGGRCEGCEAIYESSIPFEDLNEVDTLPDFAQAGPKLVVSGTVYKADGKTPAPDVVLYVYHTDQSGRYPTTGNETGWAKQHGTLRGWVKTNSRGEYRFYTLRPAVYSKEAPPAHIHAFVKEPGFTEYRIDDFVFDDDPLLTPQLRQNPRNRGGNGILKLVEREGLLVGKRDIVLGKGIENYPR